MESIALATGCSIFTQACSPVSSQWAIEQRMDFEHSDMVGIAGTSISFTP